MKAAILGDSQGDGLERVLGPVLARHGYELVSGWTEAGASLAALLEHAGAIGEADLVLVVSGGGNDSNVEAHADDYRAKLDRVVAELRAAGARDVIWVGPMRSADPRVAGLHDAARAIQGRGIRGARWIDGYTLSITAQHAPDGVHFTRNGYSSLAVELERAIWGQGIATAIGLVGTLAFLASVGVIVLEAMEARGT